MARIQQRRDTAANWASVNPVLADGEMGFIHDTGRFKIGNGSARWNDLDDFAPVNEITGAVSAEDLQAHIDSLTPHPVYDDGPSLLILYQNAKV